MKTRHLAIATLSTVAVLLLAASAPALAFDPQPDPPQVWWDFVLRIWRVLVR